jgi:hypothetical protein
MKHPGDISVGREKLGDHAALNARIDAHANT